MSWGWSFFYIFYLCDERKKKSEIVIFLIWNFFSLQAFYFIKGLNFLVIYYGKFVWGNYFNNSERKF